MQKTRQPSTTGRTWTVTDDLGREWTLHHTGLTSSRKDSLTGQYYREPQWSVSLLTLHYAFFSKREALQYISR